MKKKGKVSAPFSIGFLKQFLYTEEGKVIILLCLSLCSNNNTHNFIKHNYFINIKCRKYMQLHLVQNKAVFLLSQLLIYS